MDLDAARGLCALDDVALELEDGLREQLDGPVDDDLRQARAVAEQQEGDPAQTPLMVEPAGDTHPPADVRA
jgi:hypothetical protein